MLLLFILFIEEKCVGFLFLSNFKSNIPLTRAKFRFWFFIMLLWKMCLSIGVWMNAKYVCIHIIYLSYITSLSITDESFVNQIDWREIDFHIKYESVIIVFIPSLLHGIGFFLYIKSHSIDMIYVLNFNSLNIFVIGLKAYSSSD